MTSWKVLQFTGNRLCSALQIKLRTMKNDWWTGLGGSGHDRVRENDTQTTGGTKQKKSKKWLASRKVLKY